MQRFLSKWSFIIEVYVKIKPDEIYEWNKALQVVGYNYNYKPDNCQGSAICECDRHLSTELSGSYPVHLNYDRNHCISHKGGFFNALK